MKKLAVLFALLILPSCASWQSTARKSLQGVSETAAAAAVQADRHCNLTLKKCIADKMNPCPPLAHCLKIRRGVLQGAAMAQMTVLSGLAAVQIADKPGAMKAIQQAARIMAAVQKVMGMFR